jgi:hypothetical protein
LPIGWLRIPLTLPVFLFLCAWNNHGNTFLYHRYGYLAKTEIRLGIDSWLGVILIGVIDLLLIGTFRLI